MRFCQVSVRSRSGSLFVYLPRSPWIKVELLFARDLLPFGNSLVPPLFANIERGLCSVVAVSDEQFRNIIEGHNEKI